MKEKVIVPAMHSLIETIIQYKGFPYYGAERRLDAIISLFLEPIIKTQLYRDDPACIIEFIVPELPIKHSNNQADCVDYILSKRNNGEVSQLLLVELKTDIQSIDRVQLENYTRLHWGNIVEGLKEKSIETKFANRIKYFRLFQRLSQMGVINVSQDSNQLMVLFGNPQPTHQEKMNITREMITYLSSITTPQLPISVVYFGPNNNITPQVAGIEQIFFENLDNDMQCTYPDEWRFLAGRLQELGGNPVV